MFESEMNKIFSGLFKEYSMVKWEYYYEKDDSTQIERFPSPPDRQGYDIIIVACNKDIYNKTVGKEKHRHESFVINYAYNGCFKLILDDEERILEQGDIYIMQPYTAHVVIHPENNNDSIMITVFIKKELMVRTIASMVPKDGGMMDFVLRPFFEEKSTQFIIVNCQNDHFIKNTFNTMLYEYVLNDVCSKQLVQCALATILGLISRKRYLQLDETKKENDFARELLEYIDKHYMDITLSSVAEHFNYNPNYLSSLIRKETGKTLSELVLNAKLMKSCFLLLNTDYSISDIAEKIGFSHTGNFYKAFRKKFYISPNAFRSGGGANLPLS